MLPVVIICFLAVFGMLALVFFKPAIHVGNHGAISIFWVAPTLGAAAVLIGKFLSLKEAGAGLAADTAVNPLKILVLFFSMTLLSVFLDEAGFFRYLAGAVLRRAGNSQKKLFLALYMAVSVLTVFTSNDIVVLTFTPFICYFAKNAQIDPLPYLIGEFVAANTWSMALIIGNPTNIYLAAGNGVDFLGYTKVMILPTLAGGVVSLLILYLLFRKKLQEPMEGSAPPLHLQDKPTVVLGVAVLSLCILTLVFSNFLGFDMWLISLICCLALYAVGAAELLLRKKDLRLLLRSVLRAPLDVAPFVLSMFILVLALTKVGATEALSSVLAGGKYEVFTCGVSSFLAANLINNIPMSVLFSFVTTAGNAGIGSLYAAVIGSNIGAFFTPVGALAGIMWMALLKDHGVKLSFAKFLAYGVLLSLPTLAASLLVLFLLV